MVSTLHSLCQECIRKLLGQHCIKNKHCVEQYKKEFSEKAIEFHGTFLGLKLQTDFFICPFFKEAT